MEISLILSNDSGEFATILAQFLETSAAATLQDRLLAQQAAAEASASANAASTDETAAAGHAADAGASAAAADASATSAAAHDTSAGASATAAANSATAADASDADANASAQAAHTSETNAGAQATAAAGSATAAAASAAQAAATLANALMKANNLSDVANATTARSNLSAAKSGANSDITSFAGLTTALSVAQGGTGGKTQAAARTGIGAAASGANNDIISLSGLTTPLSVGQGGTGINTLVPVAQCYLSLSGSNLLLSRKNGCALTINGAHQIIPAAGVTLAPTGVATNTLLYIYVFMNAGTMTLEAVTTAYAIDANSGVPIKTGDATRMLVGMVRTASAGSWVPGGQQLNLLSYWNRRELAVTHLTTATTTSSTFVLIAQVLAISWADDLVEVFGNMSANLAASNGTSTLNLTKNSSTVLGVQSQSSYEQIGFSRVTFTYQTVPGVESANSLYQMNVFVTGGSGPTLNASLVELTVRVRG